MGALDLIFEARPNRSQGASGGAIHARLVGARKGENPNRLIPVRTGSDRTASPGILKPDAH